MKLTLDLWEPFSHYLFTEAKLSRENQGDVLLRSRYNLICHFFKDKPFNKLNFNAFISSMQDRKNSGAYMNNMIKIAKHLNAFLKEYYAYDGGIEHYTYFKRERKIYDIFTTKEVRAIFTLWYPYPRLAESKNLKYQAIFRLIAETGIRRLEVIKLQWTDILDDGWIRVGVKNKTQRLVPISTELYAQIRHLSKQCEYVFPGERGEMMCSTSMGTDLALRKAHLGIIGKDKTIHKFRHYFATDLMRNGAPLKHIKELLGHASLSSTEVYLNYLTEELRDTVMAYSSLQHGENTFMTKGQVAIEYVQKLFKKSKTTILTKSEEGKIIIEITDTSIA